METFCDLLTLLATCLLLGIFRMKLTTLAAFIRFSLIIFNLTPERQLETTPLSLFF